MVLIFKKVVILHLNLEFILLVSINTWAITDAVYLGLFYLKGAAILGPFQRLDRNSEVMVILPPVNCEVLLPNCIGDINLLTNALDQIWAAEEVKDHTFQDWHECILIYLIQENLFISCNNYFWGPHCVVNLVHSFDSVELVPGILVVVTIFFLLLCWQLSLEEKQLVRMP